MSGSSRPGRLAAFVCAAALFLGATGTAAARSATPGSSATAAFQTPRLYVTNGSAGTLTGVDATTGAVRTEAVLTQPRGVGITPLEARSSRNGRVVYVLCDGTSGLNMPAASGTLIALDANTDQVLGTAPIGWNANDFALSPDGRYAYVTGARYVYKVSLFTWRTTSARTWKRSTRRG